MIQIADIRNQNHGGAAEYARTGNRRAWLVGLLVALFCILVCGQAPPDVNESHYLAKARHFWDPNFCPDDLFLSSADAHWLFFASTGWISLWVSLDAYAWVGRVTVWLAFAWMWVRFTSLIFRTGWSILTSAVVFWILNWKFHLAGEWVIGGFEGKSIAYVFVVLGLSGWMRRSWPELILGWGGAIGFHALVGAWFGCALALSEIALRLGPRLSFAPGAAAFCDAGPKTALATDLTVAAKAEKTRVGRNGIWPAVQIACGCGLALIGLAAAGWSQLGATPPDLFAAARIQVTERLAHHLWFPAMGVDRHAAFGIVTGFWLLLGLKGLPNPRLQALRVLGAAGLAFDWGGLILSAWVDAENGLSGTATSLLRLYWFRFGDFAIPLGVACGCVWWLEEGLVFSRGLGRRFLSAGLLGIFAAAVGLAAAEKWRPGMASGDAMSLPQQSQENKSRQLAANWRQVCDWIREQTPRESAWITPAEQQTFKWYAQRSEVVSWKDMPQDPARIVEWRRRIEELHQPQLEYETGLLAYDDDQLRELGRKYQADFLLLPQAAYDAMDGRCRLIRIYPADPQDRVSYVILKLE